MKSSVFRMDKRPGVKEPVTLVAESESVEAANQIARDLINQNKETWLSYGSFADTADMTAKQHAERQLHWIITGEWK